MQDFLFYAPVALYFGRGCVMANRQLFLNFGRRAFIITSRFAPGCPNLALEDTLSALDRVGAEYRVFSDAEENPSVESVALVANEMRGYGPDFIIAIGGGSALDTAKAANVLISSPAGADPYKVFYDCGPQSIYSQASLPSFAIPTTAGSGSDTCGCAILTRAHPHTKLTMLQKSNFTASFLDARYIERSPLPLIDSGVLDALAHGVESRLSRRTATGSQMFSDFGFSLFSRFKDDLLRGEPTFEDYENMLAAASFQGFVLLLTSTTIPHGLGYPLSIEKGLNHGFSSTITLGEYMKCFKDQTEPERVARMCGFGSVDEMSEYIRRIISRNVSFAVTESEIDKWTDEFMKSEKRLKNHPEPISRDEIKQIYIRSLKAYMTD